MNKNTNHLPPTIPPALLIVGPPTAKKRQLAIKITQGLVCSKTPPTPSQENKNRTPFGCGECGPCKRVLSNSSESFLQISPNGHQIRQDEVQQIHNFLHLKKLKKSQVILIEEAHLLNLHAGNSLLKEIEEPPPGTHFLLTAPSPTALMATLRSRCQILRVPASSSPSFSPSPCLEEEDSRDHLRDRDEAKHLLQDWMQEPQPFLKKHWREKLRQREFALFIQNQWMHLLHEMALAKAQELPTQKGHHSVPEKKITQELTALLKTMEKAVLLERSLQRNQDPLMAFEAFYLKADS